ncbi:DUF1722 domain-containing protein [Candidatus Poribacteria bacterium]|nr:DUF1722 domain-containing protein [Candidatus Poribacteria bacterium]
MKEFAKPIVIVSKCLGFANCRYNGLTISDEFVDQLRSFVEFRPVCPELEIGLGVPRDPVRIVSVAGELKLMQPATNKDLTEPMLGFVHSFLTSLQEVDGFILKYRSPSCGLKDIKVYPGTGKVASRGKAKGFFGGAVAEKFPYLAVEDEGRLRNFRIREHFLTRLFTLANFRKVKVAHAMKELVRFHSENKLLLMAYNQTQLRILGRIVANPEKKPVGELVRDYEEQLSKALLRTPKYTSNINILLHALGYFSKSLSHSEKAFFLETIEKYRTGTIPLSVNINLLKAWIIRFDKQYLRQQTFFEPYPEALMAITDSGKGRDL